MNEPKTFELIAFWKYDRYPYCLHGTVVEVKPTGGVITKEYGYGHCFKPFLLLPKELATPLIDSLSYLTTERREALDAFNKDYNDQVTELFDKFKF